MLIDEEGALDSSVHVSPADQTDEQQEDKQTDSGVDDKHETTTEEVKLSTVQFFAERISETFYNIKLNYHQLIFTTFLLLMNGR